MRLKVKHVNRVRGRDGRLYLYHRKTGERLDVDANGKPRTTDQVAQRVLEINASLAPPVGPLPGSFDDLVQAYLGSAQYRDKADTTRRDYRRHLDAIRQAWGSQDVVDLRRRHAVAMRDLMADSPRQANMRMQILKLLLNWGIDFDEDRFGRENPALRIKRLKEGPGYLPWPDNVVEAFREAAYPELRRVVLGGILGTGQRPQDVAAMTWGQVSGGGVEVRQLKTRELVWLPITGELERALEEIKRDHAVIFTTRTGRPWTVRRIDDEVRAVMREIGHRYTPHGLRAKAVTVLYEAGVDFEVIKAVIGHRTAGQTLHYLRKARLTKRALVAKEGARTRTVLQNGKD